MSPNGQLLPDRQSILLCRFFSASPLVFTSPRHLYCPFAHLLMLNLTVLFLFHSSRVGSRMPSGFRLELSFSASILYVLWFELPFAETWLTRFISDTHPAHPHVLHLYDCANYVFFGGPRGSRSFGVCPLDAPSLVRSWLLCSVFTWLSFESRESYKPWLLTFIRWNWTAFLFRICWGILLVGFLCERFNALDQRQFFKVWPFEAHFSLQKRFPVIKFLLLHKSNILSLPPYSHFFACPVQLAAVLAILQLDWSSPNDQIDASRLPQHVFRWLMTRISNIPSIFFGRCFIASRHLQLSYWHLSHLATTSFNITLGFPSPLLKKLMLREKRLPTGVMMTIQIRLTTSGFFSSLSLPLSLFIPSSNFFENVRCPPSGTCQYSAN